MRSSTAARRPARGQKKLWKKIVIIIVAGVVLVPVLGYLWLMTNFSGGLEGIRRGLLPAPNPNRPPIASQRDAAKQAIEAAFTELDSMVNFKYYASSTYDYCYRGEYNWKVKANYLHHCNFRVTRFYGFNGDFRQSLLELDQKLVSHRWEPGLGLRGLIEWYYDKNYGSKDTALRLERAGSTYLVSDMPYAGYMRDSITLQFTYAEKASPAASQDPKRIQRGWEGWTSSDVYTDRHLQDIPSLFAKITESNRFVTAVILERSYYEK